MPLMNINTNEYDRNKINYIKINSLVNTHHQIHKVSYLQSFLTYYAQVKNSYLVIEIKKHETKL